MDSYLPRRHTHRFLPSHLASSWASFTAPPFPSTIARLRRYPSSQAGIHHGQAGDIHLLGGAAAWEWAHSVVAWRKTPTCVSRFWGGLHGRLSVNSVSSTDIRTALLLVVYTSRFCPSYNY